MYDIGGGYWQFKLSVRTSKTISPTSSHLLINHMPLALINDLGSGRHVLGTKSARWLVLVRVSLQVGRVGLGLVRTGDLTVNSLREREGWHPKPVGTTASSTLVNNAG